jgi:hypothetical protein
LEFSRIYFAHVFALDALRTIRDGVRRVEIIPAAWRADLDLDDRTIEAITPQVDLKIVLMSSSYFLLIRS